MSVVSVGPPLWGLRRPSAPSAWGSRSPRLMFPDTTIKSTWLTLQRHEAKMSHEKIEILNYDTSLRGEHVFRSLMTPGV